MLFMVCHLLTCLVRVMKSVIGLMEIECYNSFIESYFRLNPHRHFTNVKQLYFPFV